MCGCFDSSSHRGLINEDSDNTPNLTVSGELSFNGIAFLYQITEHNANIADKKRFSVYIQDETLNSVTPDNNGAYLFSPITPKRYFTVFAQNTTYPNLVFETTIYSPTELTGSKLVNISLISTAQSLIARYLKENYGKLIAPESITSEQYMATTEAILSVLQSENSFTALETYKLADVPAIKTAYTEAAENINTANIGTIENNHILLAYMAGDDRFIYNGMVSQLEALKSAGEIPGTQVIVMFDNYDASGKTKLTISKLSGNNLIELENLGKANSTDATFIQNFIIKYKRLYPAAKYSLYIGGHADSWKPYIMSGTNLRGWLLSDESDSYLGTKGKLTDIANAVKNSLLSFTGNSRQFELLILDACNMAFIETAYEFKDTSKYMIFSQAEVPACGMPIEQFLQNNNASKSAYEIGKAICDAYKSKYLLSHTAKGCISMIDCSKLDNFISKFNIFLEDMISHDGYPTKFGGISESVENYEDDGITVKNYELRCFTDPDYRDLGNIMATIHTDDFQNNVVGLELSWLACDHAKTAYNDLVVLSYQQGWSQATGLSITFPLKTVYQNQYNDLGFKFYSYFGLQFCQQTSWKQLLDLM